MTVLMVLGAGLAAAVLVLVAAALAAERRRILDSHALAAALCSPALRPLSGSRDCSHRLELPLSRLRSYCAAGDARRVASVR